MSPSPTTPSPRSRPSLIADATRLRVGLIGRGSIGAVIAHEIASGGISGVELVGVLRRNPIEPDDVASLDELLDRGCDVVVEAAGHEAVRRYGAVVLEQGIDLVVLSAGALADPLLEQALTNAKGGRLLISSGAIGGIDIARAFAEAGTLNDVEICSVTTPAAVSDVVGRRRLRHLMASGAEVTVASGTAREIALMFPRTSNVAATLALATLGLDRVKAEVRVDPQGKHKRHEISLEAGSSRASFTIVNVLATGNPQTSAVTPYSVTRLLRDRVASFIPGA